MNSNSQSASHYQRLAYSLITLMLMMPILLWPMPILIYDNPMLNDMLSPTWLLCTTFLLLSAVLMDTMLYSISSLKQAVDATIWVSLIAFLALSAAQNQGGSWLLAMLFLAHSLRAGYRLCTVTTEKNWWLWLAWSRDTSSALILLVWSTVWQL